MREDRRNVDVIEESLLSSLFGLVVLDDILTCLLELSRLEFSIDVLCSKLDESTFVCISSVAGKRSMVTLAK